MKCAQESAAVRRGVGALRRYCEGEPRLAVRLEETLESELVTHRFAHTDVDLLERLMRAVPGPKGQARRVRRLEVVTLEVATSERGGPARALELVLAALAEFPKADVVLAPEWLFLPHKGLMSEAQVRTVRRALERATRGRDVLVVPGTLAWRDGVGGYHNTALAVSGGRTLAAYDKCHDGGDAELARARGASFVAGAAPSQFTWRGLTVGLEICRDHGDAMLRWQLLGERRDHVDLHVVVSAGVGLRHMAAGIGGVVAAVDGCTLGSEAATSAVLRRTGLLGTRAALGLESRRLGRGAVARRVRV